MKMRYGIALMALAAFGLLVLPALALPLERGYADAPHYGMHFMLDNLTKEQLNNMTLAEIKELKQAQMEKLDNMTLAQIKELRAQKNDTKCQANETMCKAHMGQKAMRYGHDQMGGRQDFGRGMDNEGMMPPMMEFGPFLMMENLTQEELNNMTLAEIRELRQKNMQTLESMTLAQIKELKQQKMQERMDKLNNTTLGELMKQGSGYHEMAGTGMGRGPMMLWKGITGDKEFILLKNQ